MIVTYPLAHADGKIHTCTTSSLHSVNKRRVCMNYGREMERVCIKTNKLYFAKFSDKEELRGTETIEKRTKPISWLRSFSVACLSPVLACSNFFGASWPKNLKLVPLLIHFFFIPWSNWSLKGTKIPLMKKMAQFHHQDSLHFTIFEAIAD